MSDISFKCAKCIRLSYLAETGLKKLVNQFLLVRFDRYLSHDHQFIQERVFATAHG